MTTRRSFLAAALAACAAPAYVKAGILMPVKKVWAPPGVITLAQFDAILDQLRPNPLFHGGLIRWNGLELYDGVQWTPDQIAAMPRRQPEVVNLIRPIVRRWLDSAEAEAMFRRAP